MTMLGQVPQEIPFSINEKLTDKQYCYVDIKGIGTVAIHLGDEGISVDVYRNIEQDQPTTSCWCLYSDLLGD